MGEMSASKKFGGGAVLAVVPDERLVLSHAGQFHQTMGANAPVHGGSEMPRKFLYLSIVSILLLLLPQIAAAQIHSRDIDSGSDWPVEDAASLPAESDEGGDDEFGDDIAGSYLVDIDIAPGILPPGQGLQTLSATGEVISTDNAAFAGLSPVTPQALAPILGPGHGVWKRTGENEITNIALLQGYFGICTAGDPAGCDPSLTGQQFSTCVPKAIVQFDETFDGASGVLTTVCFFAGDDPLDPASVPFFDSELFFGPGTISYRRIKLGE